MDYLGQIKDLNARSVALLGLDSPRTVRAIAQHVEQADGRLDVFDQEDRLADVERELYAHYFTGWVRHPGPLAGSLVRLREQPAWTYVAAGDTVDHDTLDALARHLAPGATIAPESARVMIALREHPAYREVEPGLFRRA